MPPESSDAVSLLLNRASQGDSNAEGELFPLVYKELRYVAARYLSDERPNHTLQATALVHEVYLRLIGHDQPWHNRDEFFALASTQMRRILCDYARTRNAQKRGGPNKPISLDEELQVSDEQCDQIEALDEALSRLEVFFPRGAKVVQMRFFGGMTQEATAKVLKISPKTVARDWDKARSWLVEELKL